MRRTVGDLPGLFGVLAAAVCRERPRSLVVRAARDGFHVRPVIAAEIPARVRTRRVLARPLARPARRLHHTPIGEVLGGTRDTRTPTF